MSISRVIPKGSSPSSILNPIPEVFVSSLFALPLTNFMNPMTRRWKDEY